ncbi:MAG TPA: VOC family protein [Steroidobacteraceae bacterium]|jgi:catechol 2,3-dioxygenase-like lactoylglutathione lyase family enzyme|nr:VOC family protein [Steroidobacteraceae bacterium]
MSIRRIDHVQLAMPHGEEASARRFYGDVLGLKEIPKPAALAGRGGVWYELGDTQLHLGIDPDFRAAKKAHVGFEVGDLDAMAERCRSAGHEPRPDGNLDRRRFFVDDAFGNRLELIEAAQ